MKNKMQKYIKNLIEEKKILETYKALASIFDETGLYQEEAGILEKICNITKDYNIFQQIGDIFASKIQNYPFAQKLYEIYLSKTNPEFYKKYTFVLKKQGINLCETIENNETNQLLLMTDRYVAIIYILILLIQRQEYEIITKTSTILAEFENSIKTFIVSADILDTSAMNDIIDAKNHLSIELAKISHHNDINMLAINFNPENEIPYINILEDYLTYQNFKEALEFYNNIYAQKFNLEQKDSYIDLHWFVSDKFGAYNRPFDAVKFQQKAIELELSIKEVK